QRAYSSTQPHKTPEVAAARGHAARIFLTRPFCDRPGCYQPALKWGRSAARYCCSACRQAVRRVLDRERKWRQRGTFRGQRSDRHGLSFYSDTTLASRLRLTPPALAQAREELRERDLIAYQLPLVQVLSLPQPGVNRRSEPGRGLTLLGDLFRQAATAPTADDRRNRP